MDETPDPNILNQRVPEERPNEAGKARIRAIYSRLEVLVHELEGCSATDVIEGNPLIQYIETLTELWHLTGRDFDGFLPNLQDDNDQHPVCLSKDLRFSAGTLLGELRPEFLPGQEQYYRPPVQPPAATQTTQVNTTVQTDVTQTAELQVINNIKLELAPKLDELEQQYPADSKEHKFAAGLKRGLGAVKDVAGLLSLALTTGQSVGLDVEKIHALLRSLGLM